MAGFKSQAQREKWLELVAAGKIKQSDFDRMEAETDLQALPERLHMPKNPPKQ